MSEPDDAYGDNALVAEYVLHLLDDAARQAFETRLERDPALRAQVRDWEARLAALAETLPDTTPPDRVRRRLMATLAKDPAKRRSLPIWTWLMGGGTAIAALALLLITTILAPPELAPSYRAELASEDRAFVLTAGVIPATHEIIFTRVAGAPPPGRVHEIWLIAEGADAPVSLGLLEADGMTRIRVPDQIAPGVVTGTIAISEEPPGGSPTGKRTGPVVALAQFSEI